QPHEPEQDKRPLPMNLKTGMLKINNLHILKFKGSKCEISFRRILSPTLSPGGGEGEDWLVWRFYKYATPTELGDRGGAHGGLSRRAMRLPAQEARHSRSGANAKGTDSAARCPICVNLTRTASSKSLGKCTFYNECADSLLVKTAKSGQKNSRLMLMARCPY